MDEAKQVEMVYRAIQGAKDIIALVYMPEGAEYAHPINDIKDEKIQDYYYTLNSMCCELADRNVMGWQKEDQNEN